MLILMSQTDQRRFGDGPWQDVKGLDEVGSDTGRTGE
ncbi:phage tail protein [Escherichia coli]|nr:phage tail protein [Escherichia coli]